MDCSSPQPEAPECNTAERRPTVAPSSVVPLACGQASGAPASPLSRPGPRLRESDAARRGCAPRCSPRGRRLRLGSAPRGVTVGGQDGGHRVHCTRTLVRRRPT
eukprot:scaffold2200_cov413-Prasinococcus_capsulatus_cf.AAC.22